MWPAIHDIHVDVYDNVFYLEVSYKLILSQVIVIRNKS